MKRERVEAAYGVADDPLPLFPRPTSREAAESMRPHANAQRDRLHAWLLAHGPSTDEEIAAGAGLNPNAERPRRGELVASGRVRDTGRTGVTASGRRAVLWEAVP